MAIIFEKREPLNSNGLPLGLHLYISYDIPSSSFLAFLFWYWGQIETFLKYDIAAFQENVILSHDLL